MKSDEKRWYAFIEILKSMRTITLDDVKSAYNAAYTLTKTFESMEMETRLKENQMGSHAVDGDTIVFKRED